LAGNRESAGEASASAIVEDAVSRARTGDADAFHLIFRRYSKPLLSFIYNLIGDRDQAEELVQETFVRAYRRLGSLREESYLSTWLFGIARNVVREVIRRKYSDRPLVGLEDVGAADPRSFAAGPDEPLMAHELRRAVRAALAGLPEDGRVVFVLKVIHQMKYRQIARITGSSVGKLKTDLHRARRQMRQRLAHYLGEGYAVTGDES